MGIFGRIAKGLVFIVSAPAGTGKTTLVEMLTKEYPADVARSVSCTTRKPRGNEKNFHDYIFLTQEEFEEKKKQGAFLEWAKVFDHQYGTLKETVNHLRLSGKHVFLVIDTQGALKLKREGFEAVYIFINPPSLKALRERLEKRHTDTEETINLRLSYATEEMDQAKYYDVVITNDELESSYAQFKTLIGQKEKELCDYIT